MASDVGALPNDANLPNAVFAVTLSAPRKIALATCLPPNLSSNIIGTVVIAPTCLALENSSSVRSLFGSPVLAT